MPLRTLQSCEPRQAAGLLVEATTTTRIEVEPRPSIDDLLVHEFAEELRVRLLASEVLGALDSTL